MLGRSAAHAQDTSEKNAKAKAETRLIRLVINNSVKRSLRVRWRFYTRFKNELHRPSVPTGQFSKVRIALKLQKVLLRRPTESIGRLRDVAVLDYSKTLKLSWVRVQRSKFMAEGLGGSRAGQRAGANIWGEIFCSVKMLVWSKLLGDRELRKLTFARLR
jgi:hypothetical protein